MSDTLRRAARLALLSALGISLPAAAVDLAMPKVGIGSGLGSGAPMALTGAVLTEGPGSFLAPSFAQPSALPSILTASPVSLVGTQAAPIQVTAAPALVQNGGSATANSAAAFANTVEPGILANLNATAASGEFGVRSAGKDGETVVNDEGIKIGGRAAVYYKAVRAMISSLMSRGIDLSESTDVMDGTYGDVLAKVGAVEAIAKGRGLSRENTHLEETLVWVDGVLTDGTQKVAVHTHRVFFHSAKNPQSEIKEGIRRVDGYIEDAEQMFAPGGKAEQQMGRLDAVELVFDSRGYPEIKDHLKQRAAEVSARSHGRITFKYLDEIAPVPKGQAEIRAKLNELAARYQGKGLSKIMEGVIYSRYVGLMLELTTIDHYDKLGYKILQSGRELYDPDGFYVSELDAVVESPEGKVVLVEAKSARVGLPLEEVLKDKILYKLDTYKKFKGQLDGMIGKKFDEVVFSMDVGIDPDAAVTGQLPERDQRKLELVKYLRSKAPELSQQYGFPVSFLFLQSGPKMQPQGRGQKH